MKKSKKRLVVEPIMLLIFFIVGVVFMYHCVIYYLPIITDWLAGGLNAIFN